MKCRTTQRPAPDADTSAMDLSQAQTLSSDPVTGDAQLKISEELLDFLYHCPTPYHTVDTVKRILLDQGYEELHESAAWDLRKGGRYFAIRGGSSVIAFRIPKEAGCGKETPVGFMIAASHSDSPSLKVKVNPEMNGNGYIRLNVEKYGGLLMQSWFDRPLSVAGRVVVRDENRIQSRLICIDRDLVMIPRLAIHMDRTQNDGQKINPQNDLLPIWGQEASAGSFLTMIAGEAGCAPEDVLSHDLYLYARGRGTVWGANREFLSAGRLDDLQCGYANLMGFLEADEYAAPERGAGIDSTSPGSFPILAIFDNEEVGSRTRQGADSTFLTDVLHRIGSAFSWNDDQFLAAAANSFMLSTDNAHAVHPSFASKADPTNRPQMNKGIVIKYSAVQKYITDAISAAVFKEICMRAGVPFQEFTNRSDMIGGSTLGNLAMAHFSIPSVDIGLPQLSMHSSYETAGVSDTAYMIRALKTFFSSFIRHEGHAQYTLLTR